MQRNGKRCKGWLSNRVSRKPDDSFRQGGALRDGKIVRFLVKCEQVRDMCIHMCLHTSHASVHIYTA